MGDFHTYTAEQLAADLAPDEWQRLPAGVGSKGPRLYDWARLRLFPAAVTAMGSLAVGPPLDLRSGGHGVLSDLLRLTRPN